MTKQELKTIATNEGWSFLNEKKSDKTSLIDNMSFEELYKFYKENYDEDCYEWFYSAEEEEHRVEGYEENQKGDVKIAIKRAKKALDKFSDKPSIQIRMIISYDEPEDLDDIKKALKKEIARIDENRNQTEKNELAEFKRLKEKYEKNSTC